MLDQAEVRRIWDYDPRTGLFVWKVKPSQSGDKLDDRFSNLREATNAQNCRNKKAKSTNLLGIKGVSRRKYGGYSSQISVNGANHYLGHFATAAEAKMAHDQAASRLHGEFMRG